MAIAYASATGNISTMVWWTTPSGPTTFIPTATDDLDCNGKSVTLNQDVTAATLRSSSAGGAFVVSSGTININSHIAAGAATCVSVSGSGAINVVGNVTGGTTSSTYGIAIAGTGSVSVSGNVQGGTASFTYGINKGGSGSLSITGTVTGGTNNANAYGLFVGSTCTTTINGGIAGGSAASGVRITGNIGGTFTLFGNITGGSSNQSYGLDTAFGSQPNIIINGDVIGGSNASAYGMWNNNSALGAGGSTVTINGNAIAATAPGVYYNGISTLTLNGNAIASSSAVGLINVLTNGTCIVRKLQFGPNGESPVSGRIRIGPDFSFPSSYTQMVSNIDQKRGYPILSYLLDDIIGITAVEQMIEILGSGTSGTYMPNNGSAWTGGSLSNANSYRRNPAATFNGSTGYVAAHTLGNFLSQINATGATFEAWVRFTNTASRMAICGSFNASILQGFQFLLNGDSSGGISANRIALAIIDTNSSGDLITFASSQISNLSDGKWHHIVATVSSNLNSGTMNFYADGHLYGLSGAINGTPGGVGNLTEPLYIGARNIGGTPSLYFDGSLFGVRIYPRTMGLSEVSDRYFAGVADGSNAAKVLLSSGLSSDWYMPKAGA